jgi:hypothetical protein
MALETDHKSWIRRRADAVRSVYTAFDAMNEHGHGPRLGITRRWVAIMIMSAVISVRKTGTH